MKVKIPEELKQDIPETKWGKVLSSTPVIMTVIATGLAGLSSSEMTRAQYDRSMAAQMQSKAGDQWSFFQAKRLRASVQRSSSDVILSLEAAPSVKADELRSVLGTLALDTSTREKLTQVLNAPAGDAALKSLEAQRFLIDFKPTPSSPEITALLSKLEEAGEEADVGTQIGSVELDLIDAEISHALADAKALDQVTKPIGDAIDQVVSGLSRASNSPEALRRGLAVSKMLVTASRYDMEARINQKVASLYELKVRKENRNAERHHRRSGRFFYGMLAAQLAVITGTMAMASKQRNLFWALAAFAGLIAIGFASYVYIYL